MDYLVFAFIFGAIIGSFLNLVIYRYPLIIEAQYNNKDPNLNLFTPRSHCPKCKKNILARDNIPILSFLILRGKCRFCKSPIEIRYFLTELVSAVLSVIVVLKLGINIAAIYGLVFTYFLIALFAIDWQHMILPDDLTLTGLWVGLFANIHYTFSDLPSAVLGAIFGYLFLWSIFWIFKLIAKKDGLGYGDFKLLAMIGAWLGLYSLPFILLSSSLLAIVGIVTLSFLKKIPLKNTPFAFGPYLVIAGFGYFMIQY